MKFNLKNAKSKIENSSLKAFTLVETMVATVIIVIAVSGPLAVAVAASGYVRDTKDNMTSVYLAQEAIDLLRYKRNSLSVNCSINNDTASCPAVDFSVVYPPMTSSSSPQESSWKIFKEQIGLAPNDRCFTTGCFYDINGFVGKLPTEAPLTYNQTDCGYLYRKDSGTGEESDDFMYSCYPGSSSDYVRTHFSRKVVLERIATSTVNSYIYDYQDDIRAIVTVTYVRHNGLIKEIKLIDFIHSR